MSKNKQYAGQTSNSLAIFVQDTSSTTGGGLSGVTNASSGLVMEYRRYGQSTWTSVTPVSKTLGTYVSGGIVADGSLAGAYEVDFPDAAFAAGARLVWLRVRGVTNMLPVLIEIELDAVNYQDGAGFGLSRINDTITSRASQASVDTLASYVDTEVAAIKAKTDNLPPDPADASDIAGSFATVNATLATIAGYIDTEVAAIKAKTDNLPIDPADASDIAASFASLTGLVNTLTSYVDTEVAAIKAKTDNLPAQPAAVGDAMTLTVAYDAAKTAASQSSVNTLASYVDTEVAAIKAKTDNLPVDPADASDIAGSFATVNSTLATISGYIDTEVAAIKAKTDNLPAQPAAVGDIPTAAAIADAVLEESVDDHDGVAQSLAKYISIIKKANTVVDGVVSSAASPTTLTFTSNVSYPTGAFDQCILLFLTGNLAEQNSPIISYNNTNGAIVVEEAFTSAPAVGDEFIIIPTTHVHSLSAISTAVWSFTLAGIATAGSAAKVLSDAGTGIATLLTRITTAVYNTFVDLAQMIVNDGTVDAQWSTKAMENVPVAGGTGARTVTITVRDPSSNPIQNASVRVSRTGETFVLQTNASGVVVFSLNDATWTVAITATGFSFSPVSLVVAGNVSQTYNMTAAGGGVTPSEPPFCTGYFVVYNQNGTIQAGAQVSIQASSPPVGSTGIVMEDAVRTATADNNGVVQFNNLVKGATYIVWRTGSSRKFNITVPANAGNTQPLASIVG